MKKRLSFDLVFVLLIVSFGVAYACVKTPIWIMCAVGSGLFVCLCLAVGMFLSHLKAGQEKESKMNDQQMNEIIGLPMDQVKKQVFAVLAKEKRFLCIPALHDQTPDLMIVSRSVQELLTRYSSIEVLNSDSRLGHRYLGQSQFDARYVRIGVSIEHTEIVCQKDNDEVFVIDGSEPKDDPPEEHYPSIYHWILAENARIYE